MLGIIAEKLARRGKPEEALVVLGEAQEGLQALDPDVNAWHFAQISGTRALIAPRFLDIHRINDTHEHIGMIYWARPKQGTVTLAGEEHHDIRWCAAGDLDQLQPAMSEAVKWYCRKALAEIPVWKDAR